MQILHVVSSLNPAAGGPPVVAINLAKAQTALGHDVRIAAEEIPAPIDESTPLMPKHRLSSLVSHPIEPIRQQVQWADVCHLHGVWEPLLLQFAKAARSSRRPYVVTPHGMLDPWSLQQRRWKKKLALALGFRRMLDEAALIHCLNADEKRLLAPLQLTTTCAIIPNGVFLEELEPPPDRDLFRQHRPGPGDRRYILFLGRLHYKKGLDILAGAFATLASRQPDVDLVVAGPDGGAEANFRLMIKQRNLTNRVWLTGPLYGPMKWSAIVGASCFCLPSRQEGFSVAILEAMACRVPLVISDQCHFPEVEEVQAGTIVPLKADAVTSALTVILGNPTMAKTMGEAGRTLVEDRFTWNRVAECSLEHYRRLVTDSAIA